jgi:hypothetical protein
MDTVVLVAIAQIITGTAQLVAAIERFVHRR